MGSIALDEVEISSSGEYPKLTENTIREPHVDVSQAHYDYSTIYKILSSTFVSTVSFVVTDEDGEPSPFSLPMTAVAGRYDPHNPICEDDGSEEQYIREQESFGEGPFDVYLHGNSAMMLSRMTKSKGSMKVVLSSTKVDGVVLHFAPNGHSLNYRSCVIHGDAEPVVSDDEKRYAMHLLTNHMVRRRWSSVNEVAPEAMKKVQVIKVVVRSASAKIRATNINGLEKAGLGTRDDVWTGAIPLYEVLGEPVQSGYCPERPMQKELVEWKDRRNEEERSYAEEAAKPK
ncbi:flavin-nucleotide-binding protein [Rutstroemia sp. NJR-2017a BBW]|nr:flavin-nucleotide-binding protein [Rutstroemia sp. NJR-2017a BBW]